MSASLELRLVAVSSMVQRARPIGLRAAATVIALGGGPFVYGMDRGVDRLFRQHAGGRSPAPCEHTGP
jgi:hypothetical protein